MIVAFCGFNFKQLLHGIAHFALHKILLRLHSCSTNGRVTMHYVLQENLSLVTSKIKSWKLPKFHGNWIKNYEEVKHRTPY